jgi:hypothetical protein
MRKNMQSNPHAYRAVDKQAANTLIAPTVFYPQMIGICARMAELVDAPASGAGARKGVEVRVLFRAPFMCFSRFHFV